MIGIEEEYEHRRNVYQVLLAAGWQVSVTELLDKPEWCFSHAATGRIIIKPKLDEHSLLGACYFFLLEQGAVQ